MPRFDEMINEADGSADLVKLDGIYWIRIADLSDYKAIVKKTKAAITPGENWPQFDYKSWTIVLAKSTDHDLRVKKSGVYAMAADYESGNDVKYATSTQLKSLIKAGAIKAPQSDGPSMKSLLDKLEKMLAPLLKGIRVSNLPRWGKIDAGTIRDDMYYSVSVGYPIKAKFAPDDIYVQFHSSGSYASGNYSAPNITKILGPVDPKTAVTLAASFVNTGKFPAGAKRLTDISFV